jgi:hypothetical protein
LEDEKARAILDRRERVSDIKYKSQQQLKRSTVNRSKYDRSPSPPGRFGSGSKYSGRY